MAETATNPGNKTTEWKAVLGTVLAMVVTIGTALAGAFPADSVGYVVVAAILGVATPVAAYINGRSKVKAATLLPLAPPAANPPKPEA